MVNVLPTINGFTIDVRLKQFRKIEPNGKMVFINFQTDEGDELLEAFIATLDTSTKEGHDMLVSLF